MINLMLLMICTTSLLAQESSQTKGTPSILSLLQEATNAEENNNKEQALRSYQKILTINPRNKKALLGIKKLTKTIKRSDQEIQEEARTSLLQEVEKTWEIASREKNSSYSHELLEKETTPVFKNDDINTKLNSLIIPHVDLEDATIGEAIDYLRQKSCTLDPNHRGINIILTLPPREGSAGLDHPETVDFTRAPYFFRAPRSPYLYRFGVCRQASRACYSPRFLCRSAFTGISRKGGSYYQRVRSDHSFSSSKKRRR
jgi:hypothetical protein